MTPNQPPQCQITLELLHEYRQKLGEPTKTEEGQSVLNMHNLGVASPSLGYARTINLLHLSDVDQSELLRKAIEGQIAAFLSDELAAVADVLVGQATVLNTVFTHYVQLSTLAKTYEHKELLMNLALKAQDQCRKTIESMHSIKNPKKGATFIKNAIAKQVNQLAVQTEELQKRLEAQPYAAMDTGSQRETAALDIDSEAVAPLNRGKNRAGKGRKLTERAETRAKVSSVQEYSSPTDSDERRSSNAA
jgi:hypothetical protein